MHCRRIRPRLIPNRAIASHAVRPRASFCNGCPVALNRCLHVRQRSPRDGCPVYGMMAVLHGCSSCMGARDGCPKEGAHGCPRGISKRVHMGVLVGCPPQDVRVGVLSRWLRWVSWMAAPGWLLEMGVPGWLLDGCPKGGVSPKGESDANHGCPKEIGVPSAWLGWVSRIDG